jgi:hypothetical protein
MLPGLSHWRARSPGKTESELLRKEAKEHVHQHRGIYPPPKTPPYAFIASKKKHAWTCDDPLKMMHAKFRVKNPVKEK